MCVFSPFILDVRFVDVPAGAAQEEGHTEFLIHLPFFAVLALLYLARRILQPFLSLVDRGEVEFCVLTVQSFSTTTCWALFFREEKSQLPGFELAVQRVREGFEVTN